MSDTKDTFSLGLCMAGAVSAGAYTAGVMDFLIESLESWEQQRGKAGIPTHRVVIPVIGGASAGGMTSIITASAITNPITPVSARTFDPEQAKKNKFYHTWVNLVQDEMLPIMLGLSDLKGGAKAVSFLNGDFIETIADRILLVDKDNVVKRPYFKDDLELFVTLSNVNGIPYELGFRSGTEGDNRYLTSAHNDIGHFRLNSVYKNDGRIPLSFIDKTNIEIAKACAMATGAFPIGLPSRVLSREKKYLEENPFINFSYPHRLNIEENIFNTLNVDGGMINNEPFEVARKLLLNYTGEDRKFNQDHHKTRSSVLLIDPFPSEEAKPKSLDRSIGSMIGNIYETMRSQLLFKPDDIEAALDDHNYSRFIIGPKRKLPGADVYVQGAKAIACGSLGGFGGFIEKQFRIHDYFLGRKNCQQFLKEGFVVPSDTSNEIFVNGYRNVSKDQFRSKQGDLQIIPVLNTVKEEFPSNMDWWPKADMKKIEGYKKALKERIERVAFSQVKDMGWVNKTLALIGSRVLLRRVAANFIMESIEKDLSQHQLL